VGIGVGDPLVLVDEIDGIAVGRARLPDVDQRPRRGLPRLGRDAPDVDGLDLERLFRARDGITVRPCASW